MPVRENRFHLVIVGRACPGRAVGVGETGNSIKQGIVSAAGRTAVNPISLRAGDAAPIHCIAAVFARDKHADFRQRRRLQRRGRRRTGRRGCRGNALLSADGLPVGENRLHLVIVGRACLDRAVGVGNAGNSGKQDIVRTVICAAVDLVTCRAGDTVPCQRIFADFSRDFQADPRQRRRLQRRGRRRTGRRGCRGNILLIVDGLPVGEHRLHHVVIGRACLDRGVGIGGVGNKGTCVIIPVRRTAVDPVSHRTGNTVPFQRIAADFTRDPQADLRQCRRGGRRGYRNNVFLSGDYLPVGENRLHHVVIGRACLDRGVGIGVPGNNDRRVINPDRRSPVDLVSLRTGNTVPFQRIAAEFSRDIHGDLRQRQRGGRRHGQPEGDARRHGLPVLGNGHAYALPSDDGPSFRRFRLHLRGPAGVKCDAVGGHDNSVTR